MIWSVVPSEFIFYETSMDVPEARLCTLSGVPLTVVDMGDGMGRVERIMSSDPNDYLRAQLQPGSQIPLSSVVFS